MHVPQRPGSVSFLFTAESLESRTVLGTEQVINRYILNE